MNSEPRRALTVEDVAQEFFCSPTKISGAETGARRAALRDVRNLCQIYGVDAETSAELMQLAREACQQGWWTKYRLKITPYIGMEQVAIAIICFGMYFISHGWKFRCADRLHQINRQVGLYSPGCGWALGCRL